MPVAYGQYSLNTIFSVAMFLFIGFDQAHEVVDILMDTSVHHNTSEITERTFRNSAVLCLLETIYWCNIHVFIQSLKKL